MQPGLNIDIADGIARVTIDRPKVANAIDAGVITAFHHALDKVLDVNMHVRCIVMRGAGTVFSSGLDLHAIKASKGHASETDEVVARRNLDHLICRLIEFNIPIVAAVQGPAIGAGMTLALTADILVMSENAYLQPSFTRLGLVPDQGITFLLPRLIGAARARAVLLMSEKIEAHTASEWGLAYRIFSPSAFAEGVESIASTLASGPTRVIGLARSLWCGGGASTMRAHMNAERSAQDSAFHHGSCIEGIQAFFDKRPPKF